MWKQIFRDKLFISYFQSIKGLKNKQKKLYNLRDTPQKNV